MPTINPNLPSNTASVPADSNDNSTGQIDKAPPKATVAKTQQDRDKLVAAQKAQAKVPAAASSAMTAAPLTASEAPAVSDIMSIFSALEPMVGEPSGELASGFQPHGLDEMASWKLPISSDTAADLLSSGEGPATAITERLQLLHHARQLVGHAVANPKAAAEASKSKLALPVQKIFEAAMPQILAQLKATMGSPFPKKKGDAFDGTAATAHEDIEIPSGEMVKLEQTLAKPMAAAHAALKGLGVSTSKDTAAAQAPTQPVYSFESPVDKVMTQTGGLPAGMDIDALVQMVLMEAAQGGDDDLRQRISTLEATNQQQEQMRNTIAAQQAQDAASKTLLQAEYNRRCDLPTTDPAYISSAAVSFQAFSATQQLVQTPPATFDINGYPTNSPTYSLSPNMTYYPPPSETQNTEDGTPIPQAVVDQAAQLDVSPQNLYALEQRYEADPTLTSKFPTFSAFLLTPAAQGGVGLNFTQGTPQTTPQDTAVTTWMANNKLPTAGDGATAASAAEQSLMTNYGLSQSDAAAVIALWNALPASYQAQYGSDPSGLLGSKGANIPAGDTAADAHSKLTAFLTKVQTQLASVPGDYTQIEAAMNALEPNLGDISAWSNNRSDVEMAIEGFEGEINTAAGDGGAAMQKLDTDLRTYYLQMAQQAWCEHNGKGETTASASNVQQDIASLPPALRQAAAQYVQLRLQLAQKDEESMSHAGTFHNSSANDYNFGRSASVANNFFAIDFSKPDDDTNHLDVPGQGDQWMDNGCHKVMDELLGEALGDGTFDASGGGPNAADTTAASAAVAAALTALTPQVHIRPGLGVIVQNAGFKLEGNGGNGGGGTNSTNTGNTNDTSQSGGGDDPAQDALNANIVALQTPVDHSVHQPDQQDVAGSQMTEAQLAASITTMQGQMDSLGDMSEQQQIEIQLAQSRASKYYEMLSNVMKSVSDTQGAIVANMKN